MPAEEVPLVEHLSDVAGDLGDQLCTAAVLADEVADRFGLMDNHLFTGCVGAKGGCHIAGRQKRLGAGTARVAVVKGKNMKAVRLALGAKGLGRRHAVSIDNLVLRRVKGRVGDVSGPAGENPGHQHAKCIVVLGLADALSAVVKNLHESEAGIGRELAGGESFETVHSDGVRVVFFEQLEGGKIDGSGTKKI